MDWEIHGGQYPLTDALVLFMSCEMNQGYLTSQPDFSALFSIFIILTAGDSLAVDKWWNALTTKASLQVFSCIVDKQYLSYSRDIVTKKKMPQGLENIMAWQIKILRNYLQGVNLWWFKTLMLRDADTVHIFVKIVRMI